MICIYCKEPNCEMVDESHSVEEIELVYHCTACGRDFFDIYEYSGTFDDCENPVEQN